jgi:membrane protein
MLGTGSAYGAAGSLIVILVWVYHTAAILYFAPNFTKKHMLNMVALKLNSSEYAVYVEQFEKRTRDLCYTPNKKRVGSRKHY